MDRRSFLKEIGATTLITGWTSQQSLAFSNDGGSIAHISADQRAGEREFFYRPLDGDRRVGDVIPFYDGKSFRLFYLHRGDRVDGNGSSWYQLRTDDFVHFTECGEAIPPGTPADQDFSVATGSVIEREGLFHSFYTGFNTPRKSKPEQGIMHAVSNDLLHWTKVPGSLMYAPEDRFGRDDWRDPFVFWNDEAKEYWMLVAAKLKQGPGRRRGRTALCVSNDLYNWKVRDPFWAPNMFITHECPDLFRMGDWWYFVFSEYSEGQQTRYRMSRSPAGPWLEPGNDTFDTRALYAAKTCSDGVRRFLVGWNPTRTGSSDEGAWQWGGNLVAHELMQQSNGELTVQIIRSVDEAISRRIPPRPEPIIGICHFENEAMTITAPESFGAATIGAMSDRCKVVATLNFAEQTRACGLMLKLGDDLDSCYYVRLEPERQRVVFDTWPRASDVPFMAGMERPISLTAHKSIDIKVIVDRTACVIYVGDRVAMSTRTYSPLPGKFGAFVAGGSVRLEKIGIYY
jgi:beta-fructofuranosidase